MRSTRTGGIEMGAKSRLRRRLAGEQGWRCCHCGVRMTDHERMPTDVTIEHAVPKSAFPRHRRAAADDWLNLAACCDDCNSFRGNAPIHLAAQVIDQRRRRKARDEKRLAAVLKRWEAAKDNMTASAMAMQREIDGTS